jgi:hypothetical protein
LSGPRSHCVESDVDEEVLLTSNEPAASDLKQEGAHIDAVLLGSVLGVAQEAGIRSGIPQGECLTIDLDWSVLKRADDIVGRIL